MTGTKSSAPARKCRLASSSSVPAVARQAANSRPGARADETSGSAQRSGAHWRHEPVPGWEVLVERAHLGQEQSSETWPLLGRGDSSARLEKLSRLVLPPKHHKRGGMQILGFATRNAPVGRHTADGTLATRQLLLTIGSAVPDESPELSAEPRSASRAASSLVVVLEQRFDRSQQCRELGQSGSGIWLSRPGEQDGGSVVGDLREQSDPRFSGSDHLHGQSSDGGAPRRGAPPALARQLRARTESHPRSGLG